MRWPFRKYATKGKRVVSQRQSHDANVRRELRGERPDPIWTDQELADAERAADELLKLYPPPELYDPRELA